MIAADLLQRREIIVDLFAGGGGASTAIFNATGRHPDVAVNHNPTAIGVHHANHPETRHYVCDVREVDPVEACTIDGVVHPIGLLWASPDCTHFSKARGGKPVEKGIRSLADVVIVWAKAMRPRLIHLENVEEFQDWGPVLENGQPCPENKGLDFRRWVRDLHELGYKVDWRELVAADYGAPTTRKRLFLIARNDGSPIRWPQPTHASRAQLAKGDMFSTGMRPWRSAAEIIDWSIPVPSIFNRKRDLKPKTKARIAKGLKRYVVDAPAPFIVPVTHTADSARGPRSAGEPLQTITRAKGGELAIAAPTLSGAMLVPRYGERPGQEPRVRDIEEAYPVVVPTGNGGDLASVYLEQMNTRDIGSDVAAPARTITGHAKQGLVAGHLMRQFGSNVSGRDLEEPAPTVMAGRSAGGKTGLVAAHMAQHNDARVGRDAGEPLTTLTHRCTQQQLVSSYLDKYYGTGTPAETAEPLDTVTSKGRFGLASAFLEQANTGMVGHSVDRPLSTIVSGGGDNVGWGTTQRLIEVGMIPANDDGGSPRRQVLDFLWEHFGAPTESEWADPLATPGARLKFGLVVIGGAVYQIVDVGMRMLVPRELFNAQGFPPTYIIDVTLDGTPVTKTAQTSMAGNSVSPPPAEATLRANLTWMTLPERKAA